MTIEKIDLFEYASRNKLRFPSTRGPQSLTAEDLWDLPLLSRDEFNLDAVAKAVNKTLKAATEESFVTTERTPAHTRLEVMLEVVKHVIAVKKAEDDEARQRAENKVELDRLIKIRAIKDEAELADLSKKELEKRINALKSKI